MEYKSKIDLNFKPIIFDIHYAKNNYKNVLSIMVENDRGYNHKYDLNVSDDWEMSYPLVERIVKSLLWIVGGIKIYINGNPNFYHKLALDYSDNGIRSFDKQFMEKIYKRPFEIIYTNEFPKLKTENIIVGKNLDGCRIGFDAGGSDWKISSVVDGKVVYTEEVIWFPKTEKDINYHYKNIVKAFKLAACKMPRVDGIGVSSAGIYIDDKTASASLFRAVEDKHNEMVENIYLTARDEINPNIPIKVLNDGDVTALAGANYYNLTNVLGIAMGTSQAGGYVNDKRGLSGWLTELGYVPVSIDDTDKHIDWTGDYNTGGQYFSQDAVIRLAREAGIDLPEKLSLAEKLLFVQDLLKKGDKGARDIFETIGVYLGYTLPFYAEFYNIRKILLLGRVISGEGGNIIISTANGILKNEFPDLNFEIITPDEKFKRVGQAITAASLPVIR